MLAQQSRRKISGSVEPLARASVILGSMAENCKPIIGDYYRNKNCLLWSLSSLFRGQTYFEQRLVLVGIARHP